MLYTSSWHFSLGLILLTVIYPNVQSKEPKDVGDARRNIFMDFKNFVVRIFKPGYSNKPSKGKESTPIKSKVTPTATTKKKIMTTKKKKPKKKPSYLIQRIITRNDMKNTNEELRSNLFQTEDRRKEPEISDIDKKTNPKTLIIIVSNKKKVREEIIARQGLSYLGQDDFNKTMLREEYGVACIKVAVRKCYKALQRVNDIVCRTLYKCKSSFKSMFLLKAKTGCITGFDYTGMSIQKGPEIDIKNNSRAMADQRLEKYIDACIPYMLSERSNMVPKQIHLRNNVTEIIKQILRDESDKKCEKLSREACITACYYARDEVCSTYICSRKKMKTFKRECRNECKSTYAIKTDSSDSNSGSSD